VVAAPLNVKHANIKFSFDLVLTGASSKEDIEKTEIYPDYIVENLQSLFVK
jgi:ribonucleotide monophosphatase NagD (HAD superfamily)